MSYVGFKRMTIRVLDGKTATQGTNLFVIEGKEGAGATQTASITGLTAEPTKTYGSNVAYHVQSKGVGDVQVDLTTVDLPEKCVQVILGYQVKDGLTLIGADSEAPHCSILLESSNAAGDVAYLGFLKGQFSMDTIDFETKKDSNEELPSEGLKYTAIASDTADAEGVYIAQYVGNQTSQISKLKELLSISGTASPKS